MTPERLAEIRDRHDAITPWPWHIEEQDSFSDLFIERYRVVRSADGASPWGAINVVGPCIEYPLGVKERASIFIRDRDAAFIEHAPNDVDALLKAVDMYRAALEEIRSTFGQVCDEFELCSHSACQSSAGSWLTADAALGGTTAQVGDERV